jgi:hypothetical protein
MRFLHGIGLCAAMLCSFGCDSKGSGSTNSNGLDKASSVNIKNCSKEEILALRAPVGSSVWSAAGGMGALPDGIECKDADSSQTIVVDLGSEEYKVAFRHKPATSNCTLTGEGPSQLCSLTNIDSYQGDPDSDSVFYTYK